MLDLDTSLASKALHASKKCLKDDIGVAAMQQLSLIASQKRVKVF